MIIFNNIKKIKKPFYNIQRRFMQRASNIFYHLGTKLVPAPRPVIIKRDHPGHGDPKSQYLRLYDNPRYVQECLNKEHNAKVELFLKKYQNVIDNILASHKNKNSIPILRVDKDSSHLFHENGQPIYNKDGKEIDYD